MKAVMKAEELVCPNCRESVQDAGIVKVETGLTQFQSFYYHPHAQRFMFDRPDRAGPWCCHPMAMSLLSA